MFTYSNYCILELAFKSCSRYVAIGFTASNCQTYVHAHIELELDCVFSLLYQFLLSSEATLKLQISVRLSVCQPRLGGNVLFLAPNWDIAPIFCVQIPLINEHLFSKYFASLSVGNATKGFATYGCCHRCFYKNR